MSQPPSLIDTSPLAAVPLLSFRPPPDIQRAIDARGFNWHIHAIEFAAGPLNLDNYLIKILKLPSEKGIDSPEGLLRHVRLNINHFVNTDDVEFSPYADSDEGKWRSDSPLGAVMHIDFGNTLLGVPIGPLNLEDGSVVCSSYSKTHWIFSTIWTGGDANHPVSGNREFGCYVLNGQAPHLNGAYIYTRAADRITDNGIVNAFLMDKIFSGGHETWLDFQRLVAWFVERKGGKAQVLVPFSARYPWDEVKGYHKPTVPWVVQNPHYVPSRPRSMDKEVGNKI
jgi:hypothetical protein